ncbi:multidrug effflux MFS transporter [Paraburkholderia fynbosensis]|uniref:Bcr/CflA family efflux transporter n=1 Tax=Paraburkholderia fynbosensis TaxID=1200993 RepID=A0A6J5GTY4_9BURK|nr:multidrug effflux MFS transporter [Paraburkholderia fynbosensis]CAB3806938.1 Bicyclomycin resistance protein [Paraburkholderia fynbosensis]
MWLLVLLVLSGTLAMHMFVPALSQAARDLGADSGEMQLTISLYVLGLAFGQLFYGPLSDTFGRRPMLAIGLTAYTVAGFASAVSGSVVFLIYARLLQALGGCAGMILGRVIVSDTSSGDLAIRRLALLNLIAVAGPGLAPALGGFVTETFGWRMIFVCLGSLGILNVILVLTLLPETTIRTRRVESQVLIGDYLRLIRSPMFLGYAIGGGCATSSSYAFISAAPFILADLHRSLHEVGFLLGFLALGVLVGSAITSRIVGQIPVARLLYTANFLAFTASISFLLLAVTGKLNLMWVAGLQFLYTLSAGMTGPVAMTKAIKANPVVMGSAAGLAGFVQMGVGAVCIWLTGLGGGAGVGAGAVVTGASVVAQISFRIAARSERLTG